MTMLPDIPGDFEVGASIGGGNCFYDSVAQGLRQVHPDKSFTVDSLRSDCKTLAESLLDEESWLKDVPKSEIPEDYVRLVGISTSGDGIPIWGRPEIEGRMLCDVHNIRIHVIEYQTLSDGSSLFVDQLVQKTGSSSVNDIDYGAPDIIHITNNGDMHFKPVLRKSVCTDHGEIKQNNCVDPKQSCEPSNKAASSSSDDESVTINSEMIQIICGKLPQEDKLKKLATLFNQGADVNFKDANRKCNTPLHLAIRKKDMKVVEFLLSKDPDLSIENNNNKTALELAKDLQIHLPSIVSSQLKKDATDEVQCLSAFAFPGVPFQNQDGGGRTVSAIMPASPYKKRPGTGGIDGHLLEILLLIIFKLRGEKRMEEFYLAGNMDGIGAFDDVVFRYNNNKKVAVIFLQAKYKEDPSKYRVTLGALRDSDFKLSKYFQSYMKVKEMFKDDSDNVIFKGKFEEIDAQFVIYTNAVRDSHFDANRIVDCKEDMSNLLKIGDEGRFFKLKAEGTENKDIISEVCEISRADRMASLAKQLMNVVLPGKMHIMSDPTIGLNHVILADKVIAITCHSNTPSKNAHCAKFREDFLNDEIDNVRLKQFRNALFVAYTESSLVSRKENATPSFKHDDEVKRDAVVREKLQEMRFVLPKEFGNVNPKLKESSEALAQEIVKLLKQSNSSNDVELPKKRNLAKDLGKLVGNVLLIDEESGLTILNDMELEGELKIIQQKVKELATNFRKPFALPNEIRQLYLNCIPQDEKCAQEFLKKLVICTGQHGPGKLKEVVTNEMMEVYKLTKDEADDHFLKLQDKMKLWWNERDKEKICCLQKDDGFLNNVVKMGIHFDLKHPVEPFCGRENELATLHEALKSGPVDSKVSNISRMTTISGLGGIGKSELAKKYAIGYGEDYDNNIIWIDAEKSESMTDSFRRLCCDKLGISTKNASESEKDIKSIVQDVYNFFSKRKSLFIFDNAKQYKSDSNAEEGIEKFLPHSLPPNSNEPYIVVTSQNQKWSCTQVITLNPLTDEEGKQFVKAFLEIKDDSQDTDIRCLISLLQNFPLALQQAVAYIKEKNNESKDLGKKFQISDYNRLFEKQSYQLLEFKFPEDSPNEYTKTTLTTWLVALQTIVKKPHGRQALCILEIFAYLDSNNIPVDVFLRSDDPLRTPTALLKQYSLINVENGLATIHRLVQHVIREQSKGKRKDILRKALGIFEEHVERNDTHLQVMSAWNYAKGDDDLVKEFSHMPNGVIKVLVAEVRYTEAFSFGKETLSHVESVLGSGDPGTLRLGQSVAYVMYCQGKYKEALDSFQDVFEKSKITFGGNGKETLTTENYIADVLYNLGEEDKAREIYQSVLTKREAVLGLDHPDTLTTRNNMSRILNKPYNYEKSLHSLNEVLQKRIGMYSEDHRDTLKTRKDIADVLYHQGKINEAFEIYQNVFEKAKTSLGGRDPDTLTVMHSIANVLTRRHNYVEVLPLLSDIVSKRKEVLGVKHPDTLVAQESNANAFSELGKYENALALYSEVCKNRGPDDPKTLTIQRNVADMLSNLGRYDEAISLYHKILQEGGKTLAMEQLFEIEIEIPDILDCQGKHEEALQYYTGILERQKELFECDHMNTLKVQSCIADVLVNLDRDQEALEIYELVLRKQEVILDVNHKDSLSTEDGIAHVLNLQGKGEESLCVYRSVLTKKSESLGPDHPSTLSTQRSVAEVLTNLGQYSDALESFTYIWERECEIYGTDHADTLNTRRSVAEVVCYMELYEKALCMYRKVFDKQCQLLGPECDDAIDTYFGIANVLNLTEEYDEAVEAYSEIIAIFNKNFSPDDPVTLNTRRSMATVLCNAERYAEAWEIYNEVHVKQSEILGDEDEDTLDTLIDMANLLLIQESFDESMVIYRDVHGIQGNVLGLDHPDTLITQRRMAKVMCKRGSHEDSLSMLNEVLEKQMSTLGPTHRETIKTRCLIANCLDCQDQSEESLKIYDEVHGIQCRIFGRDHPDTLNTRRSVADTLLSRERYDEALQVYEELFETRKNVLGPSHKETLEVRYEVAHCLDNLENYEECLTVYRQIYEIECQIFTPTHPNVLQTRRIIADVLWDLQRYKEALTIYREVLEAQMPVLGEDHEETVKTRDSIKQISKIITE